MATFSLFDPWRADPFGLDQLRREVDQVFGRFGGGPARAQGAPFPPVNLYETAEGYVLTAEVPGLAPDDFEVAVEGRRVTLRGERKVELPEGRASLHRRERQGGVFRRTFELPVPADADKAEAIYQHGVLMLRMPKAEAHQPRRIAVQSS